MKKIMKTFSEIPLWDWVTGAKNTPPHEDKEDADREDDSSEKEEKPKDKQPDPPIILRR